MTPPSHEPSDQKSSGQKAVRSLSGLLSPRSGKTPPAPVLLPPAHITPLLPAPSVLSSRQVGWENFLVEEGHYEPFGEIELPSVTHHSLVYRLGGPVHLYQESGGQRDERLAVAGGFSLQPAGMPCHVRWQDKSQVVHTWLDAQWVASLSAMMGATRGEPEMRLIFEDTDPQISHIMLALRAELASGGLGGPLYAQHLATSLGVYLLARFSVFPLHPKEYAHGLGKLDLARVLAYIHECLTEDLSLEELAACVHLSPYHFARLFKQSVGVPPHEYVIRQRIEKSKALLRSGRLSVGEVAQAVGFSDHSKLDRHFKRLTGLSPRQFRRQ